MVIGEIVGPQPNVAYNILSLARHFNMLDAGIDTAPLYRIVDEAYQAGITDRDMKAAHQRTQDWLECKQARGRA